MGLANLIALILSFFSAHPLHLRCPSRQVCRPPPQRRLLRLRQKRRLRLRLKFHRPGMRLLAAYEGRRVAN